jgi:ABC-type transport system substrate-binding protein
MLCLDFFAVHRVAPRKWALALACIASLFLGSAQAGANPADPNKVLRMAFPAAETGFDPVRVSDLYSNIVNSGIFQPLVNYNWMARPSTIVADAAEALPEVTEDGKLYTFKIRKGLYFSADPAFKGQKRELTAQDFVYTLLRHIDPKNKSPRVADLDDKIEGFAAARRQAAKEGMNYEQRHPGIYASDRYTLHIRLTRADRNFLTLLTNPYAGGMAREVVEAYGPEGTMAHPVGTGPYVLDSWVRGSKITLRANPTYPGFTWDFKPDPQHAQDMAIAARLQGRGMPQIGRVEISIIEEPQSMWLAFSGKEIDIVEMPPSFIEKALDRENRLQPVLGNAGVQMYRTVEPDIVYQFFNLRDPVIGGYTPEKIALRRAIILGYDVDEEIRVVRKGQAIRAQQMVSPVIPGHDTDYRSIVRFSPLQANALLDQFGYKKDARGYRSHPDGKPLVFTMHSSTSSVDRERDELWKKSMDRLGIRLQVKKDKFAEMLKQGKACSLSSWGLGWIGASEAEFVMGLLSSKAIGQSNYACFENAEYDREFERLRILPDGPERTQVLRNLYRIMEVYGVLGLSSTRIRTRLSHTHVDGYRAHPLVTNGWQFMDIRPSAGGEK